MPILATEETEELSNLPKDVVQSQASNPGVHFQSFCFLCNPMMRWKYTENFPLDHFTSLPFRGETRALFSKFIQKKRGESEDLL